jgi:hypothetical protein
MKKKDGRVLIRMPKSAGASLKWTLRKYHGDIYENLGHIMPTKDNIKKYKNSRKVLLMRDPQEVKDSMERGIKTYIHNKEDWKNWDLNRINEFYYGWIKNIDKNTLLITYDELISNPQKIINKIERFWELPEIKKVNLLKIRYSRSKIRKYLRLLYSNLRNFPFLVKIKRKILPGIGFATRKI